MRQSPITKAHKRRTTSTPTLQGITELVEAAAKNAPPPISSPVAAQSAVSTDVSEDGSTSPENTTEMPPPPPPPRSARHSPYFQPSKESVLGQAQNDGKFSPATPASLMKLPSPSIRDSSIVSNGSDVVAPESIENLELPESLTCKLKSKLPKKLLQQDAQRQATLKAAPSVAPSPLFARPTGTAPANQSPQVHPDLARNNKKRTSTSVQSSPALRPKISPIIKPNLPGAAGISAEDAASQLLASKSNYQVILEGNKVPGVSYPSELSTNLTSKRTSHKIAEQGRRNRINMALQEIATLLPQDEKSDGTDNGEKKETKNAMPNSKASTVEMAIQYIKELQKRVESEKKRADIAEQRLQALRASS